MKETKALISLTAGWFGAVWGESLTCGSERG